MSLIKKFQSQSARVKGLCFHPSRPWILTSLHSGVIQIWDYNMNIVLATFDEGQGPVRGVDFHPHLPLFVSGSDVGNVRVWNYKQKRCLFILKGHIDYVRTTFFHHELPWILSASDDQTMRIWNYQSRSCINIITGHSHYVMCAQFHPEKNYIVSASLDSTIRIWDYSILKKKLTQTKNLTGFVGIQIECIKILQGHQKGCNWVSFHPTNNLIVSGSDDRKIKLWKYTNEVAWEHSTILGHKNNISCLLFDPITQNLITNSEDKSLRIWNVESKEQIITQKKQKARYWILAISKNSSLLAAGHDEGFQIYQLNEERVPHTLISDQIIIFAQGFKTYMYDIKTKAQKMELYQYKQKNQKSIAFIKKLTENPYNKQSYLVEIKEMGQQERFYMVKKKQSYLNFPTLCKQYSALDSCYINDLQVACLKTPKQIKFVTYGNNSSLNEEEKDIVFKSENFFIKRIFSSNKPNQFLMVTSHNKSLSKFDFVKRKPICQCQLQEAEVKSIIWGSKRAAVVTKYTILLLTQNLQVLAEIKEKFPIKSVYWESQNLIFYTTINHLKYGLVNGQTGVLKTIDEPFHIVKKLENNKFLAFSKAKKVYEIQFPDYSEIQFKMAISRRKVDQIKKLLSKFGQSKKKILIKQLVENGYSDLALSLVTDLQEKFSLAIQSSNFQLAFDICSKVNTQEYWKMLGEEALKQGIFQAYELSCQKLKSFDQLNFLYSLQNNTEKLQKVLKISKKTNNLTLTFNTNLFIGNPQVYEQTLREAGLQTLAQMSRQAYGEQGVKSEILKRLRSRPLTPVQPLGEDNSANWPHNLQDAEEEN